MPEKNKKKKRRTAQEVSLDQIRDMIWNALRDQFGKDEDAWVSEVYPAYIIYQRDGKYYRMGYSILDGEVQFGSEETEVEKAWVEARSTQQETDEGFVGQVRLRKALDPEGSSWEVVIVEPGFSKHPLPWYFDEEVLRDAAGLFEDVSVNLYELPQATHIPDELYGAKSHLVKNKVGWIDQVKYAAGRGLGGVLHFLDSAKWLGKNLVKGMKDGAAVYGLSLDCPVRAKKEDVDGRVALRVKEFLGADSVDIVDRPAAGGKFVRAIAARQKEERAMKKWLELIQKRRPDLLAGKDLDKLTEDEVMDLARMALEEPKEPGKKEPDNPGGKEPPAEPYDAAKRTTQAVQDELKKFKDEEKKRAACAKMVDKKLKESELPELTVERLRARFDDEIVEPGVVDAAIAEEKDYLAKLVADSGGGQLVLPGQQRIEGGIGSLQKAFIAMDKTFGLNGDDIEGMARMARLDNRPFFDPERPLEEMRATQAADYDGVPGFTGLREMYVFFTGDPEISGIFNRKNLAPELRVSADILSSTFTYALANTLGRRLVKEYSQPDLLEALLISVRKPVRDFRTQEAVLIGGFPDLADVDPEAADYEEIAGITDEESTYALGQKGNLLTISRKTVINDDISLIMRVVSKLGRAARRTHGKYVWAFIIDNGTCSDGTAIFTSGHGNLGATALSHTTAQTAWVALANMTEKDSGERLGLLNSGVMVNLIGPNNLLGLIGRIEKEEFYYSSNDLTTKLPNPLQGKVKGYLNPLFTDTNDWCMLLPPSEVDMLEMGYLNGREEPEYFVADAPQSEQVFVADKIRHKIRHEYAGAPIDYRGSYKAEVT